MKKIVLTGGIACGKSEVAKIFAERKIPVIDADEIAHQLIAKGEPAYKAIIDHFGEELVGDNGDIDRTILRRKILATKNEKVWLEELLHPLIYNEMVLQLKKYSDAEVVVLVLPLYFETYYQPFRDLADSVIVVSCSKDTQIERLKKRNPSLSSEEIHAILDAQMSNEERCQQADFVITNNGTLLELKKSILGLTILENSC